MIIITANISLQDDEVSFKAIRASGPGGQHVNATSSAVQIRFDAAGCGAISYAMLKRIRAIAGRRITEDGVLTLRAEAHSSQHRNRDDALQRLIQILKQAEKPPKYRKKTRPTRASNERRLAGKAHNRTRKQSRGRVTRDD